MGKSLIVACLFFVSSVFCDVEVAWNNSLTVTNTDLSGRITVLTSVDVPALYSGLSYTSISYSAQQGSAQADGVYGAAYGYLGAPLSTYVTYFDVSASWTAQDATSADVSGAASLLGAAYLALIEVDANGNYLSGLRLKSCVWNASAVVNAAPIKYATITGTSNQVGWSQFSISFTFVASDSAGVLTNGAVVTPKSIQTTVNILNYPFQGTGGNLILVVGLGSASGTASGTVTQSGSWNRLMAGSGKNAVWFDGATQAYVDSNGTKKSVTFVSSGVGVAKTTDFDGAKFLNQIGTISNAQHSLVVDYRLVNITFPQSANITYDPSIGVHSWFNAGATVRAETPLVALVSVLALVLAKVM